MQSEPAMGKWAWPVRVKGNSFVICDKVGKNKKIKRTKVGMLKRKKIGLWNHPTNKFKN